MEQQVLPVARICLHDVEQPSVHMALLGDDAPRLQLARALFLPLVHVQPGVQLPGVVQGGSHVGFQHFPADPAPSLPIEALRVRYGEQASSVDEGRLHGDEPAPRVFLCSDDG